MAHVIRYATLRYFPWSERDEFVNIGVVLQSPLGAAYRLLEPRHYRLTTALDRDDVVELWEAFEFALFRTKDIDQRKVQADSKLLRPLSAPLEKCLAELSGTLQCSDIRTIEVSRDEPHLALEYLNSLFERYVVRRMKQPKKITLQPRRLLSRRLRSDFAQWQVLHTLLPGQDLIVRMAWPMDYIYRRNGWESGIQVIDCSLKRVSQAIRIAYGAARDIEETRPVNISVIAVAGNYATNPDAFALANRVLAGREPVTFIDYDNDKDRQILYRVLQTGEPPVRRLI
jgi:hypothetical protein